MFLCRSNHAKALQTKEEEKNAALAAKDTQFNDLIAKNSTHAAALQEKERRITSLTTEIWIERGIIAAAIIGTVLYIYRKPIGAWCKRTFAGLFGRVQEPQPIPVDAKVDAGVPTQLASIEPTQSLPAQTLHSAVVSEQCGKVEVGQQPVAIIQLPAVHKESLREKIKKNPRTTPLIVVMRRPGVKVPQR